MEYVAATIMDGGFNSMSGGGIEMEEHVWAEKEEEEEEYPPWNQLLLKTKRRDEFCVGIKQIEKRRWVIERKEREHM